MLIYIPITYADTTNVAHYTKVRTFGLSATPEKGSFKIITFLPPRILLFDINLKEPDIYPLNDEYLAATTQDGVRLFLLESDVSKRTFDEAFGNQDIIFNSKFVICKRIQCDINRSEETIDIDPGDVFLKNEITLVDGSVIYKLIGNLGSSSNVDNIVGYISSKKLSRLIKKSIVTYAPEQHPRYSHDVIELNDINTKCGKKIKKNEPIKISITENSKFALETLNVAEVGGVDFISYINDLGGDDKSVKFKIYKVYDKHSTPIKETIYTAKITYVCTNNNLEYIESVLLYDTNAEKTLFFTREGTPTNLREFTKSPYLYSVNNAEQHFDLLEILSDEFEDRSLAGYFLAGFNRSCKSEHRNNKACGHNSYRTRIEQIRTNR